MALRPAEANTDLGAGSGAGETGDVHQGECSVLLTRLRGAHPPWDFLPAVCPSVTLWLMFSVAPKSAIAVLLLGHVSYITW